MIPKEEVLNKIEKGTFIWVGDNFNVRKRIAQVERLTKTQIVIGRWERYFRLGENAGWQVGTTGCFNRERVTGIVSQDQVRDYKRKRAEEQERADERQARTNAANVATNRISCMFAQVHGKVAVSVDNLFDVADGKPATFTVKFYGLTEREAAEISEKFI